jgi:hypothetical protein
LSAATRVSDPLKLSILANITLLDELAALRRETGSVGGEDLGRLAERLIGRLDEELGPDGPSRPVSGAEKGREKEADGPRA